MGMSELRWRISEWRTEGEETKTEELFGAQLATISLCPDGLVATASNGQTAILDRTKPRAHEGWTALPEEVAHGYSNSQLHGGNEFGNTVTWDLQLHGFTPEGLELFVSHLVADGWFIQRVSGKNEPR